MSIGADDTKDEARRDQAESAFTPLLRWLASAEPEVRAVTFVDQEGECVDYCSALDPFDAKVAGAHMQALVRVVRHATEVLGTGEPYAFEVYCADHELLARRVDEHYTLVVVVAGGGTNQRLLEAIERALSALRTEAILEAPVWDPHAGPLEVHVRPAVGWSYAPIAFRQGERYCPIADVLGRWTEPGGPVGGQLECFRVRTPAGVELTLVYDPSQERWLRW